MVILQFEKNYKRSHWKEWRIISSHDFYAHAEFETPVRSHRMWIIHTVDFHIL